MKAICLQARDSNLVLEEIPTPKVGPNQALVAVYACGVSPNELTWSSTEHLPVVLGHEIAGIVTEVASNVTQVKVGDPVYALTDFWQAGGMAEYIATAAIDLAPKPKTLDFIQAASVPLSALTAWQGLFDYGKLQKGQKVLIHGASGGVGCFAVQLAKWKGAHVAATASTANIEFVKSLGADLMIDYKKEQFEEKIGPQDLVLDLVGGDTLERSLALVTTKAQLVTIVKPHDKATFFIVKPNASQLREIGQLIDEGLLHPIVETTFSLQEAQLAFEKGHRRGKSVIEIQRPQACPI